MEASIKQRASLFRVSPDRSGPRRVRTNVRRFLCQRCFVMIACLGLLCVCCVACGPAATPTLEAQLRDTPTPTPAAGATLLPSPTPTATGKTSTSISGLTPTGRPTVTGTPTPEASQHLVVGRDGSILYGDLRGEEPMQIAQLQLTGSWDLSHGRLAMVEGGLVQMVDLVHGTQWAENLDAAGTVLHADLLWGHTGRNLLVALLVEDNDTTHMILQAVDGDTGALLKTHSLAEGAHALALSYDDAEGAVWLALLGGKDELEALEIVFLDDTKPAVSYALRGRLPVALETQNHQLAYLSPDGASICTQTIGDQGMERCV